MPEYNQKKVVILLLAICAFMNIEQVSCNEKAKLHELKICQSHSRRVLKTTTDDDLEKAENKELSNQSTDSNNGSQIVLPLTNMLNLHYDTELYFGKNKQPFKLIIDTGSTDLWIPTVECTNCKENNLWKLYNCDKSSTCHPQDKDNTINIGYGVGSVQGYSVKDYIYMSDKDQTGFEYEFLLINQVTDLKVLQMQGIIGLGRDKYGEYNSTILGSMKEKGIIDQRVFSLFLSDSSCLGNSVLTFGGFNEEYTDSPISYIQVNNDEMWSVNITSAALVLNSKSEQTDSSQPKIDIKQQIVLSTTTVVIDSGTTKIVLPKSDLNSLMDALKSKFDIQCQLEGRSSSAEILTVVCAESDYSKYPSFWFTLGVKEEERKDFVLTSDDYIENCFYHLQVRKCALRFQYVYIDDQKPVILLGDTFLRKYYTVFDMDNERIGFALAKVIQPKPFYETSVFSAYLGLALTLFVLILFLISCKIHTMWQDRVFERTHSVKAQADSPPNTTGPDDLHHQRPGQIEMQQGHDQSLEDPNDLSEEISQDDISEIDQSQNKNQQSYRLPITQIKK